MDSFYEIGQIIKGLREQNSMSQEEIAFKCGMQPGHISKIERGTHKPNVDTLKKLANGFGLSIVEFLSLSPAFLQKPNPDPVTFKITSIAQSLSKKDKNQLLKITETFIK